MDHKQQEKLIDQLAMLGKIALIPLTMAAGYGLSLIMQGLQENNIRQDMPKNPSKVIKSDLRELREQNQNDRSH